MMMIIIMMMIMMISRVMMIIIMKMISDILPAAILPFSSRLPHSVCADLIRLVSWPGHQPSVIGANVKTGCCSHGEQARNDTG